MANDGKIKLLFICLGNICRSPAAQGIMEHLAEVRGVGHRFLIDSAGIGSWHVGDLPDRRMREHGRRHGYTFDHRARQFHASADFDRFDLILTMDDANFVEITGQALTDEERAKVVPLARPGRHRPARRCLRRTSRKFSGRKIEKSFSTLRQKDRLKYCKYAAIQ